MFYSFMSSNCSCDSHLCSHTGQRRRWTWKIYQSTTTMGSHMAILFMKPPSPVEEPWTPWTTSETEHWWRPSEGLIERPPCFVGFMLMVICWDSHVIQVFVEREYVGCLDYKTQKVTLPEAKVFLCSNLILFHCYDREVHQHSLFLMLIEKKNFQDYELLQSTKIHVFWASVLKSLMFTLRYASFYNNFVLYVQNMQPLNTYWK